MNRNLCLLPFYFCLLAAAAAGCQQKMAEQPYYRPYEPDRSGVFADGRSNRPLELGTIHRNQRLEFDPRVTGLTREEWERKWALDISQAKIDQPTAAEEDRTKAIGAPRFDPPAPYNAAAHGGTAHAGPQIYTNEFPFEMTAADIRRGEERFTAYCAVCHGPLGNGKGKIWERSLYKPTSYHTEKVEPAEPVEERGGRLYDAGPGNEILLGYSRGYWRWGIRVPVREVPPGYIFEVITHGFGLMADYAAQIKPDDRWRIVAYIRVLQLSQRSAELKTKAEGGK